MRNIVFRKHLYSALSKTGFLTFGLGAASLTYNALQPTLNQNMIVTGLGVAVGGIATHLVMNYKAVEIDSKFEYIDSLKNNKFYKEGLYREKEKLEMLEDYLDYVIDSYSTEDQKTIKENLRYEQVVVDKKIELIEENDKEELNDLLDYINSLNGYELSEVYLELKDKFFNTNRHSNNKVLKFKKIGN